MERAEYVSIRANDANEADAADAAGLDRVTAWFAMGAAVLGWAVSLAAITFVVLSLRAVQDAQ